MYIYIYTYYHYFLYIKEAKTLFFALLDRLIRLELVEG